MMLARPIVLAVVALGFYAMAGSQSTRKRSTQDSGQVTAPPRAAEKAETTAVEPGDLPVTDLSFVPKGEIPGMAPSNAVSTVLCDAHGTLFVSTPKPPMYQPSSVESADLKGSHTYDASTAPGLYDLAMLDFFPGDDMVGLLVHATRDAKQSQYSFRVAGSDEVHTRTGFHGEHYDYVLKFDRDGNYRATIELTGRYQFRHFAELADGNFVAIAYDRVNRVPRLLLLDSDGQVVRPLEIPSDLQETPELNNAQSGDVVKLAQAESSLSLWRFAPVREHVLMYFPRRKPTFLEIGAGGSVREVPIESPPGYVVDEVLPSNDRWIVQYRKEGLPDNGAVDSSPEANNFLLAELNPGDGSLRRTFHIVKAAAFGVACELDGTFLGLSHNESGKFVPASADTR